MNKKLIMFLILVTLLISLGVIFIHECSAIGGMGFPASTCECIGKEWVLYDRTPADGPMRSICLGIVNSTDCYQFLGGPKIDCTN